MSEPFDIHDHRHQMKQLRESSDTGLYDNRDGVSCPVCAAVFDRAVHPCGVATSSFRKTMARGSAF